MNDNLSNVETEDSLASLLEFAADNDVEGFKQYIGDESSTVDGVGLWYGRQKGSNQMVIQHRTPLMVAATYGSLDVLKLIISLPEVDVNRRCGADKSTALHCAASSGSQNAVNIVKLLLAAGADPDIADANGFRPFDVIVVPIKYQEMKYTLQAMLSRNASSSNSPPMSPSRVNGSPKFAKINDASMLSGPEKKEYPIDPSLPDINNSIYSTDEFRMFSFKVRPCSRAYSHDWTECPFVHPGENARRRDPRKYHYSCVPCPDFRKGACRRGDMCEYAHGVFESWLHPAQYRTRICKDGTSCNRRVCFFAHMQEELRPLYVSTGCGVPSPRSVPMMSPSAFTPPMSPSNNGISNMNWPPQQNVPPLHLPGSNLQSSRLRSSLNARDIQELSLYPDIDVHLLNELSLMSHPSMNNNMLNRSPRPKILTPSNLEEIFSAESSSPGYSDHQPMAFSPKHQQSMLSPIKTNFMPRNVDHSLLQAPFGLPSPGRMSPRNMDPISPMSARMSMIAQYEKQHQQFRSLSSRELGSNAAAAVASLEETRANWRSLNGSPEWAVNGPARLKRSSSFELLNNGEEPDLSWVQSLVKESPQDMKEKPTPRITGTSTSSGEIVANSNTQIEEVDESLLGAWIDQMKLDQLMAQ
ncbi:hypothetical protein BUALT_Bualt16G0121500 [Buddleja alternifolia]|uniref:C3H1-type domain-containing protein n=1 Tax=Buddleja alternifolia TaxID=168488 RepID=A0AAV6WIV4_9LAMI|nr:hypothetical protein BUALT_Bualt16G0121500 [Buddleja alternifolia]